MYPRYCIIVISIFLSIIPTRTAWTPDSLKSEGLLFNLGDLGLEFSISG